MVNKRYFGLARLACFLRRNWNFHFHLWSRTYFFLKANGTKATYHRRRRVLIPVKPAEPWNSSLFPWLGLSDCCCFSRPTCPTFLALLRLAGLSAASASHLFPTPFYYCVTTIWRGHCTCQFDREVPDMLCSFPWPCVSNKDSTKHRLKISGVFFL